MRLGVAAVLLRLLAVARRDGTEKRPVLVGESWPVVQAVQHCELVTQHDDLKVLRASRAHSQASQRGEEPAQNATHGFPGCQPIMPGQRTRPYFGHPQAELVRLRRGSQGLLRRLGGTCGSPRVRAQLRRDGLAVSKKTVEASMARQGLQGRRPAPLAGPDPLTGLLVCAA